MSRIVTNQCLMRLRKNKRAAFLYLDQGVTAEAGVIELPDTAPTPDASLYESDTRDALHNEIRKLPPLLRNVLVLSDLNELPIGNVAERLGISIVAAKSRLQRSRAELRRRLLVPA
jgi:RNA polymerase sigma-70 factor (ECF subfamily)